MILLEALRHPLFAIVSSARTELTQSALSKVASGLRTVNRSAAVFLLVVLVPLLVPACSDSAWLEAEPRVLARLEVQPKVAALATVAPGDTVELKILAFDQGGATMSAGSSAATWSSSAPGVAGVNTDGVVTAAAPGTAEITATLTLGGVTRTASVTVTVYLGDYSDLAGVYDLTAVIRGATRMTWQTPAR
jgi:hypothetical protein